MKTIFTISFILNTLICLGQTSFTQNFSTVVTYNYTGGTLSNETKRGGASDKSLRIGRNDGPTNCNIGTDNEEIVFEDLTLIGSSCPGTFQFYHSVRSSNGSGCGSGRGLDSYEGFAVYRKLNGASAWTLISSYSGFSNNSWSFTTTGGNTTSQCGSSTFPNPFIYYTPAGTTSAQFKIMTIGGTGSNCTNFNSQAASAIGSIFDRGDEGLFIDDVSFTTISPCILPIELLDFYATQNEDKNDLVWKVATEKNVQKYLIEKSEDGINFLELTRLDSKNFSEGITSYTCQDVTPFNEITYYRLSTIETNGLINTDKIISIDRKNKSWKPLLYQQNNELIVEFKNNLPKKAQLQLFDLSGKQLVDTSIELLQTKINIDELADGIYFVKIATPYKIENFKVVISN